MSESNNDVVNETSAADCEALSGRGLDAAVAEAFFDYNRARFEAQGFPEKWIDLVPPFSTDLNACFEAQAKCIEKVGQTAYWEALCRAMPDLTVNSWLVTATAEQRCRAMLNAIQQKGDQ